ncbi:hypothetical protein BaRGS_00008752 [Batillaria attramentaria]|uniref:UDENN domain-containing protein n=1 Tax=Batillaria attramentaria TaxID=370345 RepID=A0ABD0LK53_9CAEN
MEGVDETNERSPDEDQLSPTMLPWDRFSNWIHCCCVVTFDLELGQAMELIYPGHIKLSDKEKMNICYLSFPDSNSGCMGDTQFHFRIRQCPGRRQSVKSLNAYNRDCPVTLQSESAFYYGFVYFRQTKDRSIRRGYFQKSVVLITRLPFVALFSQLVGIIAPEYFDNGEPSLEAACHDIDQWPSPVPGDTLNLPIMGTVIQVRVPCRSDKVIGAPQPRSEMRHTIPAHTILPSLHEVDIYSAFQSILPHVQLLWELVLIGEPVVVMAASPSVTSACVQALVNMIAPLRYCNDFRPYFTIHDSEFKEFTTRTQAPPPVILGVTNPFFAKTLQHWPHIIRIGEMGGFGSSPKPLNKLKRAASLKTLDSKPGVYTQYKTFLAKDKMILKRLMKGTQSRRPVEAQNAILRRHFLEMTQSFMIPLERYMASLMPLQRNISPHKGPPRVSADSGALGSSADLRHQGGLGGPVQAFLQNLSEWIQDKEEVEIVDLILRIKEKLKFANNNHAVVQRESVVKLQTHLQTIVSALPDDLQSVIKT